MSSRVFALVGRNYYARAIFKQSTAAAGAVARPGTSMMMKDRARSSLHHIAFQPASASRYARYFSDKTSTPPPPPPPAEEANNNQSVQGEESPTVAEPEQPSKEEQLETELKAARDQLLRSLAEQENTRRIAQRDVQDARNFAVKSFAKSLLEVSDNLSRALQVVPEELRRDTQNHPTLATLYEGIEMTEVGLLKAFESNGLKKFGVVGELFDPNKHEALYEYPDPEKTPGTVGQVIKVGYLLNDRVLRPAEVGVVKKD